MTGINFKIKLAKNEYNTEDIIFLNYIIEGQNLKKVIFMYLIFAFVLMSFAGCSIFRKTVIGILAVSTVVLFKRVNKLEAATAISEAYVAPTIKQI